MVAFLGAAGSEFEADVRGGHMHETMLICHWEPCMNTAHHFAYKSLSFHCVRRERYNENPFEAVIMNISFTIALRQT